MSDGGELKKNAEDTPEFSAGMNHAFYLVQMCLFKMWDSNDILDFESINDNIKENLESITGNKQMFAKWFNKFNEYIKSKGSKNDDI